MRSITEHLIDSTWYKPIFGCIAQPNVVRNFPPQGNEGSHKKNNKPTNWLHLIGLNQNKYKKPTFKVYTYAQHYEGTCTSNCMITL